MSDTEKSCCCGGDKLIFACSGAADVGAIADQAARKLTREGAGKMFCLAGIGGRVEDILAKTRQAESILAIDGCDKECVKHCLEAAGFTEFAHIRLDNLGLNKGESPVSVENVGRVFEHGKTLLA